MAAIRCDRCGKTDTVSTQQKILIASGAKVVRCSCGGKFR